MLTLGIWLFVTPNQINFGGMIGLAQLIDYFIHKFLVLPKSLNTLGMINLLMNIPLFIFGYKIMNKNFVLNNYFFNYPNCITIHSSSNQRTDC